MNIKPVKKYSGILPAAAALLGSLVSGCDRQAVVGSVPNPNPKDLPSRVPGEPTEVAPTEPEKPAETTTEIEPAVPAPSTEPEELPQLLGGDVPAEHIHHGE